MALPSNFHFVAALSFLLLALGSDGELRHVISIEPVHDHLRQFRPVDSKLVAVEVRLALFQGLERVLEVRLRARGVSWCAGDHDIDGSYNLKETAHRSIPLDWGRANIWRSEERRV